MSEEKTVSKPLQLWNNALKAVKGESTGQLIEQFTAEMTLVAEGLCEDQARLRQQVEDVRREEDRTQQRLRSEVDVLDTALHELQRDTDRRLDDMSRRIAALESKQNTRKTRDKGIIQQATILASIVCGTWLAVTVLNLLK